MNGARQLSAISRPSSSLSSRISAPSRRESYAWHSAKPTLTRSFEGGNRPDRRNQLRSALTDGNRVAYLHGFHHHRTYWRASHGESRLNGETWLIMILSCILCFTILWLILQGNGLTRGECHGGSEIWRVALACDVAGHPSSRTVGARIPCKRLLSDQHRRITPYVGAPLPPAESSPTAAPPTSTEPTAVESSATSGSAVTASCPAAAPVVAFDVAAINVGIPLNRFGDHDPEGRMPEGRMDVVTAVDGDQPA